MKWEHPVWPGSGNSIAVWDFDPDGLIDNTVAADTSIVWLGDAAGHFISFGAFGDGFPPGNVEVTAACDTQNDPSLDCETDRSLDQLATPKCVERLAAGLPDQPCHRTLVISLVLSQPADRGPPLSPA
ncbi:MAG: hypothetical protein WAV20_24650 [Blastocatellia bacterium]